jgi:hypothetical protein
VDDLKLTRWYPSRITPVRKGMYQSMDDDGNALWRYWNGQHWGWGYMNKRWAYNWRNTPNGTQAQPWRGIFKETDRG